MKGARVRLNGSFPLHTDSEKIGTVIAESELCIGVRLDDVEVPVLVRKAYVRVLTDGQ